MSEPYYVTVSITLEITPLPGGAERYVIPLNSLIVANYDDIPTLIAKELEGKAKAIERHQWQAVKPEYWAVI